MLFRLFFFNLLANMVRLCLFMFTFHKILGDICFEGLCVKPTSARHFINILVSSKNTKGLQPGKKVEDMIKYVKGDLFQLTKTTLSKPLLIAHACNCLGIWGGGIASVFKTRYFSSYELYHTYCHSFQSPAELLGTSLLLPVSSTDAGFVNGLKEQLIVVCLFTSIIGQESEIEIAKNTERAMLDLRQKLQDPSLIENEISRKIIEKYNKQILKPDGKPDLSYYTINMPKINAGIFGVPWELTEKALEGSKLNCQVFVL